MELFINAILAGVAIAIGGIINLKIGGIAGAIFFSVGLYAVLNLKFALFTGKAGKFAEGTISMRNLAVILFGNFIGTFLIGFSMRLLRYVDPGPSLAALSSLSPFGIIFMSILCGILMYVAVECYSKGSVLGVALPVAAFILMGARHSIADSFYMAVGSEDWWDLLRLVGIVVGNFIGCNFIPLLRKVVK